MKILKTFFVLSLMLLLSMQLLAAEALDQYMAKSEAERAANNDVNKACWFGAGMTIIGAGVAMIWASSSPNPAVFAGRSPLYIRTYTNAYRSTVRRTQTMYSCIGCGFTLTMAGCALLAMEVNEDCNESCATYNEESCDNFMSENCGYGSCWGEGSCLESSEEESSSCGSSDGSSCGSSDGSSCGSSDGSSCGSSSGG
jgi:uncharacterized membrane protein YgcG